MDFIDWCHHILGVLEKEKLKGYIHYHEMPEIVFSKTSPNKKIFTIPMPLVVWIKHLIYWQMPI